MSIKISALSAVLDANLTDGAVVPITDASGTTTKATLAQWRRQIGFPLINVQGAPYNAKGDGVTDDTAAFAAAQTAALLVGGVIVAPPVTATYLIGSALALTCGLHLHGVLKPANGITVSITGPLSIDGLKHFDTSLGGVIRLAPASVDRILPEWWGAVGDATTDDTVALQAAITTAMTMNDLGGAGTVRLSKRYKTTDSLHGFRWTAGAFTFTTFHMDTPGRGYITAKQPEIIPAFTDRPVLIVQALRASTFTGLTFTGALSSVVPTYDQVMRDTGGSAGTPWWNSGSVGRDDRYSPYCALAIDPFSAGGVPAGGGIPGHSAYYTQNIGSSKINVEKCAARNFVVAWGHSLSNGSLSAEDITFLDCIQENVKVAHAVGQSQNRNGNVINTSNLYVRTMIDCVSYGQGNGVFPNVVGGSMAGGCKWLIIGNAAWSTGSMKAFYGESVWSLGFWGWNGALFPFTFDDCSFQMIPAQTGTPAPGARFHAVGPVTFRGGFMGEYNNVYARASMYSPGKLIFDGTALTGEPVLQQYNRVEFRDVPLIYNPQGLNVGLATRFTEVFASTASNADAIMGSGAEVFESLTATEFRRWRWQQYEQEIVLDAAAVITVAADGTATFTSAATAAIAAVGDHISARTGTWNAEKYDAGLATVTYQGLSLGRVKTIVGSVITLDSVPITMVSATHNISIRRLPRFKPRTVGITTNTSNVIASVNPISMWHVGDRIAANANVPAGSYVTAVNSGAATVTISQNATGSGNVELYDNRLFLEDACRTAVPTGDVWFVGDFVRNTAGTKDVNNEILSGWRCTVSGRADGTAPAATFETVYVKTTSP